jgi:hypothetical protein
MEAAVDAVKKSGERRSCCRWPVSCTTLARSQAAALSPHTPASNDRP